MGPRPLSRAWASSTTSKARSHDKKRESRLETSGIRRPGVSARLESARTRRRRSASLPFRAHLLTLRSQACSVCTRSVARRRRKDPGALCPSPSDTGEGSALTSNLVAFQEIWRRAIGCWNRARISTQRILAVGRLCAGPCRCYTYNESTG